MIKIGIFIVFILVVIAIKALINGYRLKRLTNLEQKYHAYMRVEHQEADIIPDFLEKVPEIIELLEKAGQKSKTISRIQNSGFGYLENIRGDLFENITTRDSDIYTAVSTKFKYAVGTYKKRLYEAFNPLYWIEFLVFLPTNIAVYLLGEDQKSISNWIIRIFNIIYWIVGGFASVLGIIEYFK